MILLSDIKPKQYLWLIPVLGIWFGLTWLETAFGLLPRASDVRWLVAGPLNGAAAALIVGLLAKGWGAFEEKVRRIGRQGIPDDPPKSQPE